MEPTDAHTAIRNPRSKAPRSVELHIEELVLHGFSHGDRYRIASAVEQEVARLLAEQGLPSSFGETTTAGRVDAGTFRVAPGGNPEQTGAGIGQTIYGGLSRER